jgi:hypothetical protein
MSFIGNLRSSAKSAVKVLQVFQVSLWFLSLLAAKTFVSISVHSWLKFSRHLRASVRSDGSITAL